MSKKIKTRHSVYKSVVAINTQTYADTLAEITRQVNSTEQQLKTIQDNMDECEGKLRGNLTNAARLNLQDYDNIRHHLHYLASCYDELSVTLTKLQAGYQEILAKWEKSRKLEDKCQEYHDSHVQQVTKAKDRKQEQEIEDRAMQKRVVEHNV
jgi:ABC-type transporter Mla subunit MlaD